MKTMNTKAIAGWFQTQGMPQAAAQFSDLYFETEYVEYSLIERFLHKIYGTGDDAYIFRKMQCDISTQMTPGWI
jgi:hypothetical protein